MGCKFPQPSPNKPKPLPPFSPPPKKLNTMIINDPCFQRKLKMYQLLNGFDNAVVIADSPERAKEMMVQHTSNSDWADAEDIQIITTGEEQIISESM